MEDLDEEQVYARYRFTPQKIIFICNILHPRYNIPLDVQNHSPRNLNRQLQWVILLNAWQYCCGVKTDCDVNRGRSLRSVMKKKRDVFIRTRYPISNEQADYSGNDVQVP